ncbi:MAG TPA: hypothetical protein VMR14_03685 [Streptosporangiaceae bacterium]|jgi:putative ABC transport system permease protein|nr:hypothetical protein [Streptosporangiaceae bacterium]
MRTWARRTREAFVAITGTGAGASAVLALLVLATVFVCVATPRASLSYRTTALRQLIAATPANGQAVVGSVAMPTLGGALGPLGQPDFSSITGLQFGPIGAELARHLRADGLPLTPGASWWGAAVNYVTAPGIPKSAYNGSTPPQLEVLDRSSLGKYSKLAAGQLPSTGSINPNGSSASFQVAVTTLTAAKFSLRPGSVIRLADSQAGSISTIYLHVTGILAPVSQSSSFWTADPDALRPSFNKTNAGGYWLGAIFVADSEVSDLESAVFTQNMTVTWDFPLSLKGVTANEAAALNNELTSGLTGAGVVTHTVVTPLTIGLAAAISGAVTEFVQVQSELGSLLALLYVSLTVVGLVVLLLGARLLAERWAGELALIRARGGARAQLAILTARAGALVVIPATVAGVLLGVAVTPGQDESLAWWLAGITAVVALAAVPWLAIRRAWTTGPAGDRADSAPPRESRLRRVVYDIVAVAVAVAGLVVLRLQGPPPPGSVNWYTSAAPVLVAVPVAVIVVRACPVLLRWLVRLAGRRRGVTSFVGFARATRASATIVLPAFALVLALGVIAFGAMLRTAVVTGDVAQSWRQVGADAVIDASGSNAPLTPAVLRDIEAVPGVRQAAAVTVTAGATAGGSTVGVLVINPVSYAKLVAATPARRFRAGPLSEPASGQVAGPIPALASPGAAGVIGGQKLLVGTTLIPIRIAATVRSTPGVPETGPFIVLPAWAADRALPPGSLVPNQVLVTGPVQAARLGAVVARQLPGATTITYRSAVLAALTGATLPRGAYTTFAEAAVAAAGFGAIILLIMLALGARPRELTLARLFTMGLSRWQARALVVAEALPAIAAAAIGGAVCAYALVPLVGPSIDLSPFTGSGVTVPLRADFAIIGYLAGCLVVLALATLFAQAAATRLRGVSRALRVGE